jgi:Ca-activated chloride channel family protein
MLGLHAANPGAVHLVWPALAIVALLAWLEQRGRTDLGRFVSALMAGRLAARSTASTRIWRLVFVTGCLLFGVVALMRPQSRGVPESISADRLSADIMVVLDVSKSMLAEDSPPSRLARAKTDIREMVGELRGHRVGLIAFAGRPTQLSPLTPDYAFFRMALRGADPDSVQLGGTRIGDALRKAVSSFGSGTGSRIILLITDGEDHDSYPMEAATAAADAGVRVIAIGFGSEEGSQILITDEHGAPKPVLDADGQPVISRLDGKLLREMALATEGAYVPAGTAALDLESIVREHVKPIVRAADDQETRVVPREQYPWFVLGALVCLIIATGLGGAASRRTTHRGTT